MLKQSYWTNQNNWPNDTPNKHTLIIITIRLQQGFCSVTGAWDRCAVFDWKTHYIIKRIRDYRRSGQKMKLIRKHRWPACISEEARTTSAPFLTLTAWSLFICSQILLHTACVKQKNQTHCIHEQKITFRRTETRTWRTLGSHDVWSGWRVFKTSDLVPAQQRFLLLVSTNPASSC